MHYEELAKINVNEHIEKKNGLSYLSWAWAVDQLLRKDPDATWEYADPIRFGESVMVFCAVTAFGRTRKAQLPVMDHRNKAIPSPDAFQVNVAMQRCLAKAIALHGIGLYIYAGEDLPEGEYKKEDEKPVQKAVQPDPDGKKALEACGSIEALSAAWKALTPAQRATLGPVKDACKEKISALDRAAATH